ncbi:MAG: spermidine/putrescine transport system substrate-binding protein [Archaeoglobaceae archaeon]|nr:spermidine/putrescine transport system substrate-binding protein [Archaeoglobaceae archaeon]MDK2876730.1 spermidine/putrescine transport system substrate-binding protein [Archaeoglobaceae archaeon]
MVDEGRRDFLKIAVAGIAGLAIGGFAGFIFGSSSSRNRILELESEIERMRAQGQKILENELRVYNWSYYIHESLLDVFSEQTGIPRDKIIYEEYEDPNYVLAKLEAGASGYDVVILPDYCVDMARKKNLLLELDKKLIPNAKFLDEKFLNLPYDPEGKYSIVYMWGSTGFAWRKGVEEVTTLEQIFNPDYGFLPKYKKKITMLEEATEVICSCKAYLGKKIEDWSDETLEEVKEVLIKQKPYLAAYAGANVYYEGLKKGTIYVAHAYNGDIVRLREEFSEVEFGIPEEGGTIWTDNFCIPKDARHVYSAHEFINFLLDPAVAAVNSQFIGYANPVKQSYDFLGEFLEDPVVYPPEEIQKKMWLIPSLTDEERRKVERLMIEVKAQ